MRKPALQTRAYFDRLARFLGAYLAFLDCRIKHILDAGCGPGFLHRGLRRAFPGAHIDAIDISEYVCSKFGWQCSSIEDYDAKRRYDLVICHDVMQYLDRPRAMRALEKLGKLTRGALYFSVLTREDWDSNCDQGLTDGATYRRLERLVPQDTRARILERGWRSIHQARRRRRALRARARLDFSILFTRRAAENAVRSRYCTIVHLSAAVRH